MFQNTPPEDIQTKVDQLKNDYLIQPGDQIALKVYTREGASLIESVQNNVTNSQINQQNQQVYYIVSNNGTVNFPVVGEINAVGLTESQLKSKVTSKLNVDYKQPYVDLRVTNRRAFVITSEKAAVVPLNQTPTSIFEVISLFGGIGRHMSTKDIMIIRGNLRSPEVFPVNLNTFDGISKSELTIQSNDIIYIQEKNRALYHSIQDITPVVTLPLSIISATISTILLFYTVTK